MLLLSFPFLNNSCQGTEAILLAKQPGETYVLDLAGMALNKLGNHTGAIILITC
jgi:hypothetical protein